MHEIFRAIDLGLIKRTRKPGLIKIILLEDYIKHCSNMTGVCKTIAYSMVTEVEDRNNRVWELVFKCYGNIDKNVWRNIAVYSNKQNIHTFNDLICINFKIIRENPNEFFYNYPQIKSIILSELRCIDNE